MNACPCCAHAAPEALPEDATPGVVPRAFQRCGRCGHVWSLAVAPSSAYYQSLVGRNAADQATLQAKLDGRIASLRSVLRDGLRILEVGCAEGALGQRIKQEFQVHYVGLEPSKDADTARHGAPAPKPGLIPLRQGTLRLKAHPGPRDLHGDPANRR